MAIYMKFHYSSLIIILMITKIKYHKQFRVTVINNE